MNSTDSGETEFKLVEYKDIHILNERAYNMKKILLLGRAIQQIPSIIMAKKLGYYTITCDFLLENPDDKHQWTEQDMCTNGENHSKIQLTYCFSKCGSCDRKSVLLAGQYPLEVNGING